MVETEVEVDLVDGLIITSNEDCSRCDGIRYEERLPNLTLSLLFLFILFKSILITSSSLL